MATTAHKLRLLMAVISVLVTSSAFATAHPVGFDPINGLVLGQGGPAAPHATPIPNRPPRWPRRA